MAVRKREKRTNYCKEYYYKEYLHELYLMKEKCAFEILLYLDLLNS